MLYDKNGNITSLTRNGHLNTEATSFGMMDDLRYHYDNGNKLITVDDKSDIAQGFKDGNTSSLDYSYDVNGNMVSDANKGIASITYNHLNLPTRVNFENVDEKAIIYTYDAVGVKLSKKVINEGSEPQITLYAGNYVYKGEWNSESLQFFNHPEGYVQPNNTGDYDYVYQYKDHLGNVRLSYADTNNDGEITASSDPNTNEIIEEKNYYPFGLTHKGYNNVVSSNGNSVANKFGYNGIELEESLGLNLHEMDFRLYDPTIGRFNGIDPVTHHSQGTSVAFDNNPIYWADPSGADSQSMEEWFNANVAQDQAYNSQIDGGNGFSIATNNSKTDCPKCDNPDILYDFVKQTGVISGEKEAKSAIKKTRSKYDKFKSREDNDEASGQTEATIVGESVPITGDESVICSDCGTAGGWYATGRYEFNDTFQITHKGKDHTFNVKGVIRTYKNKEDNVISELGFPKNNSGYFVDSQPMIRFFNRRNKEVARLIFEDVTQMNNFMSHYYYYPKSKAKAKIIREYNESIPKNRRKN